MRKGATFAAAVAAAAVGAALALAAAPGCSSGDDPCLAMLQHLQDCGIGTDVDAGSLNLNCNNAPDECIASCVTNASCDELKSNAPSYVDCLKACPGVSAQ